MNRESTPITISFAHKHDKLKEFIVIGVIFLGLSIWIALFPSVFERSSVTANFNIFGMPDILFIRIVGVIGVLFAGTGLIEYVRLYKLKEPALSLGPHGLSLQVGPTRIRDLSWSEVGGARIIDFAGQKFLAVDVSFPWALIQWKNGPTQLFAVLNIWTFGTPVTISESSIGGSLNEMISGIERYRVAYGASNGGQVGKDGDEA